MALRDALSETNLWRADLFMDGSVAGGHCERRAEAENQETSLDLGARLERERESGHTEVLRPYNETTFCLVKAQCTTEQGLGISLSIYRSSRGECGEEMER